MSYNTYVQKTQNIKFIKSKINEFQKLKAKAHKHYREAFKEYTEFDKKYKQYVVKALDMIEEL